MHGLNPAIKMKSERKGLDLSQMRIGDGRPTLTKMNTLTRSVRFLIRTESNFAVFQSGKSTEENHQSNDMNFYGKYAHIRKTLDYSYHRNYTEKRQRLQNSIIQDMLSTALITDVNGDVCTTPTEPWLVFTAGAMGAGKGYTIKTLVQNERFPLLAFVTVDPDEIRRLFPEYNIYLKSNPEEAGQLTRKEAGLVAEILTLAALQAGKNVLVDGSLRDSDWYQNYFKSLRNDYPSLKIGILHVTAPREAVIKRAEERGIITGRVIPRKLLEQAIVQVPRSVKILAPLADYFCEIDNPPDGKLTISIEGETWEKFQSRWLQTCAWVPGRRKKILENLKAVLHVDEPEPERYEHIPRRYSFSLEEKKQASSRALNVVPRRSSLFTTFSVDHSTEENYKAFDMRFYGSFAHIRKTRDYTFHSNYTTKRQWLHDSIIEETLVGGTGIDVNGVEGDTPDRPWIIFTAGVKGAGKRYTINSLLDNGTLPLVGFVAVDPEEIRNHLPEHILYMHNNPDTADDLTRREVRYISELTSLSALHTGKNVIFDGCLKDTDWYKKFFSHIREEFKNYRIAILQVGAPVEQIYERIEFIKKQTGKGITKERIQRMLVNLPKACEELRPHVDYFCELYNPRGDFKILTDDIDWDSFTKNWEQKVEWDKARNKRLLQIPRR